MREIKFTPRQALSVWMIIGWFVGRFERTKSLDIPTRLMSDLYGAIDDDTRKKLKDSFEKDVAIRIVKLGKWLEEKHPDLLTK